MIEAAVLNGSSVLSIHRSDLIHESNQDLDREDAIVLNWILCIDRLDQQPVLVVQCLQILLDQALVDPEVSRLNQALEEGVMQVFALFIKKLVSDLCQEVDAVNIYLRIVPYIVLLLLH